MGLAASLSDMITAVVSFLSSLFSRRNSEVDGLREQLSDVERQLSEALSEGRITDSMALRTRREDLRSRLARLGAASVAVAACALAGCRSPIVPVVGERVFAVTGASSIDLPDPVPPARLWYVVDDVCLKEWLGIETVLSSSTNCTVEVRGGR